MTSEKQFFFCLVKRDILLRVSFSQQKISHTLKKKTKAQKKMDSTRLIKRARVDDDDWPYLFDITDLAKLVFQYVPKMQCRQFVRDIKGTLQYTICLWMPQQDIDIEIQLAILKADNVLCLSWVSLYLPSFLEYPLPNMLPHLLHDQNVDSVPPSICIPLCNLQMIAPRWTQPVLGKHVRALIENDGPGFERLQFTLGLLKTPLEVGDLLVMFDLPLWHVLRPWIGSLLTIQRASDNYLSEMPSEEFGFVPKSTYEHRANEILNLSIQICNWNLATFLWNDDAEKSLNYQLAYCIDMSVVRGTFCFDSDFCLYYSHLHNHAASCSLRYLNSALQTFSSLANNPARQWLHTFLSNSSSETLQLVFEHAWIDRYEHIIDVMQCFLSPNILQITSSMLRLCNDLTILESAWPMIEDDIRSGPLQWIRSAFNNNNTVLWQFLFDKHILTDNTLSQTKEKIRGKKDCSGFEANNLVQSLGFKPVTMLATIWNLPIVQGTNNLAGLMDAAERCRNLAVLQFLNDSHAQLSRVTLLRHWDFICSNECHNLVSQVGNTHPPTFFLLTYANASFNIRETLWAIAPITDPIMCLNILKPTLDMCVFLLQKNAINAKKLIDTLKNNKRYTALLDDIRAYTYCAADE